MRLYRLGPDGAHVVVNGDGARFLHSDPFETLPGAWEYGRELETEPPGALAPVLPRKIVGVGRNYVEHAAELGNEMPEEPLLFLKAPTSVVGPKSPIVLPPESARVDFEGEVAVVIRERIRRVDETEGMRAVLGVTAACDVTARDLQRSDATFARAKSFDTFCPLGPAILIGADTAELTVTTRVNGEERQSGSTSQMAFPIPFLVSYVSHMMTLEPGDVILTGTPSGVGPLATGDRIEVEVSGVGTLESPVTSFAEASG